jgi:hypothetical protein
MPDLACGLQQGEGLGHLVRVHERIGPMQQQHVEVRRTKTLQDAIHRRENMDPRRIVAPRPDAAL